MPDVVFYGILFIIYQEKLIVYDKSGKIFSKKAGKRRKKQKRIPGGVRKRGSCGIMETQEKKANS